MWPFSRGTAKERAGVEKVVRVNGSRYRIRRINPLLDFNSNDLPQVFSSIVPGRRPAVAATFQSMAQTHKDMALVLQAGVVEPALVKVGVGAKSGNEGGLTAYDLLRDFDTALKLYIEIVDFSLHRLRGLKGLFFSTVRKLSWYALWRRSLGKPLSSCSFQTEATP